MTKARIPTKNRRQFDRLPFDSDIMLYSGSTAWTCQLIDISLKGVLFSKPDDWQGSLHDVYRLTMSQSNSPSISMSIEIAHINDDSLGAMWNKIDVGSFSQLKRILELNTLEKNKISKEISWL
jgi:hypothetical protein